MASPVYLSLSGMAPPYVAADWSSAAFFQLIGRTYSSYLDVLLPQVLGLSESWTEEVKTQAAKIYKVRQKVAAKVFRCFRSNRLEFWLEILHFC